MKKATFGCIENGMCGWVRRRVGCREMGGVYTVVLPKVMVGLINIRYRVILSRETGINTMLGVNAGKGM